MASLSRLLKTQREQILAAAERHGALSIRVFGSVAEGTASETSDIDFLVEMSDDSTLFDRAALVVELRRLLGRDVDVVTEKALKPRIRSQVVREAVAL